ncbi:MAG: ABC transporter substrate-binding protein, partial [Pseudolabrys sp.]
RWEEGRHDRLPALVADLVQRRVTVIAATGTPAALAAKAANTTIPIVFETGADPIKIGLVADLSRPGGQVTGVSQTNVEMAPKRMQLLHELIPTASVMALFVDPADGTLAEVYSRDVQAAARILGVELHILNVSNDRDLDGAFAKLIQLRAGGLVISGGAFFRGRNAQVAALTLHHMVPAIFADREFAAAGGLLSYGAAIADAYRLAGHYTGRILKGDKPADLPVQMATKVELYINLKTAKALGLNIPNTLIGRADEVIE